MAPIIIDGNKIAEKIKLNLLTEISGLKNKGTKLKLASIIIGENLASKVYISNQQKYANSFGIDYFLLSLPENISEVDAIAQINKLNNDNEITGIILQMPLPKHLDSIKLQRTISPYKDADGVHPQNLGMLVSGEINIVPATAASVWEIAKESGIEIKGKEVVVIGHSAIVGKPTALLFLSSLMESATVTVCHIATKDLKFHTRRADILVVAVGKPNFITKEYIKEGSFVIAVGINRVPVIDVNGNPVIDEKGKKKMKTVGDVDFENVKNIVDIITPVPGGVGPLTVVMLMKNIVNLHKLKSI